MKVQIFLGLDRLPASINTVILELLIGKNNYRSNIEHQPAYKFS